MEAQSFNTILDWIHKLGLYVLNKEKEKADDWIIILDESIQLGSDKILVVLVIRESQIDFSIIPSPNFFPNCLSLHKIYLTLQ